MAPEIDTTVDRDGATIAADGPGISATMVGGLPDLFVGLSEARDAR